MTRTILATIAALAIMAGAASSATAQIPGSLGCISVGPSTVYYMPAGMKAYVYSAKGITKRGRYRSRPWNNGGRVFWNISGKVYLTAAGQFRNVKDVPVILCY